MGGSQLKFIPQTQMLISRSPGYIPVKVLFLEGNLSSVPTEHLVSLVSCMSLNKNGNVYNFDLYGIVYNLNLYV